MQTIPEPFVKTHKMFNYIHALLRHKTFAFRIFINQESHKDIPYRKSHLNFKGNWRQLAEDWNLKQNQTLRFKYVEDIVDEEEILYHGEEPIFMPVFDFC